jgi:ribonuclease HI
LKDGTDRRLGNEWIRQAQPFVSTEPGAMTRAAPHYLLFARGTADRDGAWSFVLQAADGSESITAADSEPEAKGERLELLAVVRGLESLDQPSRVTIITSGRYVQAGIAYGLDEWRSNDWMWESYGQMVPVKNQDLWQRLDRAMRFHRLEVRRWRIDPPHVAEGEPADPQPLARAEISDADRAEAARSLAGRLSHVYARFRSRSRARRARCAAMTF